jgi:hypothetical protein
MVVRDRKKTNLCPFDLAPDRGLPSQHLSMLLVRSYRTFAPLPKREEGRRKKEEGKNSIAVLFSLFSLLSSFFLRRYFSVALSSRSLALGVTQQVWSFRCPDFPQGFPLATASLTLLTNRVAEER